MKSIYRDSNNTSTYGKYYAESRPSENCVFCGSEKKQLANTEIKLQTLYVAQNSFPYNFWDMKKVEDQLMIIPIRHIFCMSEMNSEEFAEYVHLVKKYSNLGYDVFVRNKNSVVKTIQHLHIHLIRTKEKKLDVEIKYSEPVGN